MAGLSLGLGLGLNNNTGRGAPSNPLCEAISKKVLVSFSAKNKSLLVAPHVVYRGNKDEPQLDAIVVESDGKAPNKPKLETFVVADLSAIELTATPFEADAGFDPSDAKYLDKTVCVVEVV